VPAASFADSHEQRYATFATRLWPRIKEADPSGLLIFASSYFEFVRLRGFFKQQGASIAVNSEYTDSSNVMRARMRFRKGERKLLLYTERAHFYFRPKLRCALDFLNAVCAVLIMCGYERV
jgi:U3 small nucleolar RNA-associated protein 25